MRKWISLLSISFVVCALHAMSPSSAARPANAPAARPQSESSSLDYTFFKTRVEPIFLKKRPGSARCYVCHEGANHALHLEKLPQGSTTWNDEESRKNFDTVSQLVNTDDPLKSKLLLHPLAPEAGGDAFHSGGRQFKSKDDPDWKTLAEWARGQKAN
jgi:hypothetical protein